MDNYHVYQAIGHGKYSTVYKGRKKKNIPYLAIKSVDKSQKSKVLQEVRILLTLDHPNVLKFFSWYETPVHLWLVLEYCVGGDLLNLLRQDNQLPEDSIQDLACGIVRALQFLHSKGIIYCDLKPSNILLDENGQTKLCDFGLARKLGDISKTPFSSLPQAKRGTPFYMAPELFQEGGVHSYASDLWALGCVLYECYAGRPPFFGKELTKLIRSILLDPVPTLPGCPSRPFVNLINSLLVKNPAERIQWPELCTHAFWGARFTLTSLPPQPAFSTMIEHFHKMLTLHSTGTHQINTPPKHRAKDPKGASRQVENSAKGFSTPVKASECSQRAHAKVSSKVTPDRPRDGSGFSKGVNVLRLSKIAKSNLQKENDKENYRRVLPTAEIDVEVNVENTDMELDFNENMEEDVQDEAVESNNFACSSGKTSEVDNSDQLDDSKESEVTMAVEPNEVSVASPSPCVSPQIKARRDKDPTGYMHESDSSKLSNLSQLLWHLSDFSARPIMPTRKADKVLETVPPLPFDALSASDFARLSEEQLHAFSSRIITILNGNATASEKQNVMKYLEMVSCNTEAAIMLTNGPVMLVLVKMLRQSKSSAMRVHAVSLIALLIRHSTFLTEDLANSGILRSLSDGLRDKQERMRRFSMAALGELLFYIATQDEQSKMNNHPESPSKENKPSSSAWQVSGSLISLVSSVLRKGEDDLTQLYALKTIENICSQGAVWAARFTTQDVIANLSYIFRAAGKQEIIRITAGSCLARLVCFSPSSVQFVIEKVSFKDIASGFVKGSPREQQICLNLLNTALLGSHMFANIGHCIAPLLEDRNLVMNLVSLIEQGNEILRGKSLIFVGLLCKTGRRGLSQFFSSQKLLSAVDKLLKDNDEYLQKCLQGFVDIVASLVPGLLETITGDIQQHMGGRKQGHIPVFSRTPARTHLHLLPVVLHLIGNCTLRRKAVNHQVLQQLANLFKLMESKFQGRDDFQITLLRILEYAVEEPSLILKHADIVCRQISQSVTILYKGNKDGNARFLCLKILFDIMVILLNGPSEGDEGLRSSISACKDCFFSLYPIMIDDEDPIPMYAQKLLLMLMEFGYIKITDILDQQTVSRCFDIILCDFGSANVSNLDLCLALASASELGTSILSQLKVVRKIGNFLEFVNAKEMEDFIDPVLSLCRVFLLRSLGRMKDFTHSDESDLVFDGNSSTARKDIKDITALGCNIGILIELSGSQKSNVADIASQCVVLLLKTAPREAATGLLTSLPKMTPVLMSLSSPTILCRMLLSLDYGCRQYVLQAMILSIPAQEIAKIEAIVLQLKTSDLDGVSEACLLVSSCLQQLAPYI